MLDFSDQPYEYFPPRYNALVAFLTRLVNRHRYLPRTKRIATVQVSGQEALLGQHRRGDRILLLPNHPTHADAAIFIEAARQVGLSPQFMAAYDVFLRSRFDAFVMQRIGAFSVDREGSDSRAMKQAIASLKQGRMALTIFPEGNVYLQNDQVTPFHEGAAFLALRAAKELAKQNVRILIVPVSIKVTHLTDSRPKLVVMMRQIAEALNIKLEDDVRPLEVLRILGVAALLRNLLQRGIAVADGADLPQLIHEAAQSVLEPLEAKLELQVGASASLFERIRQARRVIHEVRSDPQRWVDHGAAASWADQAMLGLRIASYSGQYVASKPSVDRIAETAEKLTEDLHGAMIDPIAPRKALVRFNEPLLLDKYLEQAVKKTRQAVTQLTADCESAAQRGLDELNSANRSPGGALWEQPFGSCD